jgi:hypothetical protein
VLLNFMPSSTAAVSEDEVMAGTVADVHTEHGQLVVVVVSEIDAVLGVPFRVAVMTAV